jgi:transketolase N-terminal domain/subunit
MFQKKSRQSTATIDLNGKQIDGSTGRSFSYGSIRAKFEALTGMFSKSKRKYLKLLLVV